MFLKPGFEYHSFVACINLLTTMTFQSTYTTSTVFVFTSAYTTIALIAFWLHQIILTYV
jgi:hypothetical protein